MAEEKNENVVIFPFMAQGHITPFLALAKLIERRKGYTVTFVSTPLNITNIRPTLPLDTTIRLAELPFCSTDHGLPPNTENTLGLSYLLISHFVIAAEALRSPFKQLLVDITENSGRKPVCVITDMFLAWTVEVANDLGIYHSTFIAGGGYGMAIYFSVVMNMPKYKTGDEEFSLPDFPEAPKIQWSQLTEDRKFTDWTDPWSQYQCQQLSLCMRSHSILLNNIAELENSGLEYFRRKTGGRHIWPIGPTCSSSKAPPISHYCLEWLDIHPPASVLYISFGSQFTISASQIMELAMGLEASGKSFIWVIRPPIEFGINEEFRPEWLPEGFEDQMRENKQGLLVRNWAPQLEILSHSSTGTFLSHCGWNSIIESLTRGIPIIAWPLAGEQFFNSNMLEKEVGVCIEVVRGINSDIIGYNHIAEVISNVMGDTEKGENMRRKTRKVKKMMNDALKESEGFKGSSVKAMNEFLNSATAMTDIAYHSTNGYTQKSQ
ncbi:hypothetical protein GIB67_028222 [Kingdonia uniflora]|uniref:Glycosyltransferase N-terminal domain-containing protein n=1 Tax=Kingdonia uniflora TaxID=39325 RepID=A0A7J7KZ47_9MAGN|nr:hypothetical protein GIB67_028222 [Kingdonia uniflora]